MRALLAAALVGVALFLLANYLRVHQVGRIGRTLAYNPSPVTAGSAFSAASLPEVELLYPTDKLFITVARDAYQTGELKLSIPRLGLGEVPVMDGASDYLLRWGPGLYDYAQLPGAGNCNVSIAGHRDVYGAEFYLLDKLGEGDVFYLTYQGVRYGYVYEGTQIVGPEDWGPIYAKPYSCLTLTSCDPVGTAENRIVVTARQVSAEALPQG